jgi:hypothetical protein
MKKKKNPATSGTVSSATGSNQPATPPPPAAAMATQPAPRTNAFKGFILLVVSLITLLIFFGFDNNKRWLNERIIPYWEDFKEQKLNLDIEERKMARYQSDYLFAKDITGFFEKRGIANKVLVLVPPSDFFAANGINVHVPEPAVFYYYTGLKTIWPNSPEAAQANWYVTTSEGRLIFDSVTDKKAFQETIAAFNKYKTSL